MIRIFHLLALIFVILVSTDFAFAFGPKSYTCRGEEVLYEGHVRTQKVHSLFIENVRVGFGKTTSGRYRILTYSDGVETGNEAQDVELTRYDNGGRLYYYFTSEKLSLVMKMLIHPRYMKLGRIFLENQPHNDEDLRKNPPGINVKCEWIY